MLGIPAEISNHANYIGHWLKKLKDDKRFIFKAAAAAQKASDYMMAFHPEFSAAKALNRMNQIEPPKTR